jgi:hypothetical protein
MVYLALGFVALCVVGGWAYLAHGLATAELIRQRRFRNKAVGIQVRHIRPFTWKIYRVSGEVRLIRHTRRKALLATDTIIASMDVRLVEEKLIWHQIADDEFWIDNYRAEIETCEEELENACSRVETLRDILRNAPTSWDPSSGSGLLLQVSRAGIKLQY